MGLKNNPFSWQTDSSVFVVPYSDHSSYTELMDMVSKLAPRQVVPIVHKSSKAGWPRLASNVSNLPPLEDMSVYSHLLTTPPPETFEVPETVVKMMRRGAPILSSTSQRKRKFYHNPTPRPKSIKGVVFTPLEDEEEVPSPYREAPLPATIPNVTHNINILKTNSFQLQSFHNLPITSTPIKSTSAAWNERNTNKIQEETKSPSNKAYNSDLVKYFSAYYTDNISNVGHEYTTQFKKTLVDFVTSVAKLQYHRVYNLYHSEYISDEELTGVVEQQKKICHMVSVLVDIL